jgi:glutamate carboxypeptidase
VNALVEAARQVLAIAALADPGRGTTVTPTVARAGTADNVVPAEATIRVDVRVTELDEAARIDAAMAALAPVDGAARVEVAGGVNRPPMPAAATAGLFAVAREVADAVGVPIPDGTTVGGGSDGNFTAALGVPTLDGLGVVGGGAHSDDEFVLVDSLVDRATLLAGLITRVLDAPTGAHSTLG